MCPSWLTEKGRVVHANLEIVFDPDEVDPTSPPGLGGDEIEHPAMLVVYVYRIDQVVAGLVEAVGYTCMTSTV